MRLNSDVPRKESQCQTCRASYWKTSNNTKSIAKWWHSKDQCTSKRHSGAPTDRGVQHSGRSKVGGYGGTVGGSVVWHHLYRVMQLSLRLHLSPNMKIRVPYVSRNQKEQTGKLSNGERGNICTGKGRLRRPSTRTCHYKARLICILPLKSCLPWRTFLALCAQVTLELAFGAVRSTSSNAADQTWSTFRTKFTYPGSSKRGHGK